MYYYIIFITLTPTVFGLIVIDPWLDPKPCKSIGDYSFSIIFISNLKSILTGEASIGGYLPDRVRITGCATVPCTLVGGETMHAYIDFATHNEIQSLRTEVNLIEHEGASRGINFPYAEVKRPGCDDLISRNCPLYVGQNEIFKLDLPIVRLVGHMNVLRFLQVGLRDENNVMTMCFQIGVVFEIPPTYYV